MKKNNLLLVVDGENLLHRSFHKFHNLKSSDGVDTGAVYGFMKSLHSNIFRFNPHSVVITFDNGRSKHRTDILPDYKGKRAAKLGMDYESLQAQKKKIRRILRLMNIPVIFDNPFKNQYESDDYICWVTMNYPGKIIILSSDKDFAQLINDNVKQMNPSKDLLVTTNNCKATMGYSANECVDYLSLIGDTSDNIPGVPGIGEKKARIFLDEYGSIGNYLSGIAQSGVPNANMTKGKTMGMELIDLRYFVLKHPLKSNQIPVRYGKGFNQDRLDVIFKKLSMNSLRSEEFLTAFKQLRTWKI